MTGPHRRPRGLGPARKVEVRLSEAEYDAVVQAARRIGRGVSLSRFMADATLQAAGTQTPPSSRSAPSSLALAEVMDAVTAVNRIGNNLNQLAREKYITGLRPVGAFEEEQRARTALARLADTAQRAAGMTGGAA